MNWTAIKREITADPAGLGYAGKSHDEISALLNAPGPPTPQAGRRLTERGILDLLGPTAADSALSSLETAAADPQYPLASVLRRVLRILQDPGSPGLDFGNAQVRSMLDVLQSQGKLTAPVVASLKAFGAPPGPSRAETLGLGFVGPSFVRTALERG